MNESNVSESVINELALLIKAHMDINYGQQGAMEIYEMFINRLDRAIDEGDLPSNCFFKIVMATNKIETEKLPIKETLIDTLKK